jgi:hypothetical protein
VVAAHNLGKLQSFDVMHAVLRQCVRQKAVLENFSDTWEKNAQGTWQPAVHVLSKPLLASLLRSDTPLNDTVLMCMMELFLRSAPTPLSVWIWPSQNKAARGVNFHTFMKYFVPSTNLEVFVFPLNWELPLSHWTFLILFKKPHPEGDTPYRLLHLDALREANTLIDLPAIYAKLLPIPGLCGFLKEFALTEQSIEKVPFPRQNFGTMDCAVMGLLFFEYLIFLEDKTPAEHLEQNFTDDVAPAYTFDGDTCSEYRKYMVECLTTGWVPGPAGNCRPDFPLKDYEKVLVVQYTKQISEFFADNNTISKKRARATDFHFVADFNPVLKKRRQGHTRDVIRKGPEDRHFLRACDLSPAVCASVVPEEGCPYEFDSVEAFSSHFKRHHARYYSALERETQLELWTKARTLLQRPVSEKADRLRHDKNYIDEFLSDFSSPVTAISTVPEEEDSPYGLQAMDCWSKELLASPHSHRTLRSYEAIQTTHTEQYKIVDCLLYLQFWDKILENKGKGLNSEKLTPVHCCNSVNLDDADAYLTNLQKVVSFLKSAQPIIRKDVQGHGAEGRVSYSLPTSPSEDFGNVRNGEQMSYCNANIPVPDSFTTISQDGIDFSDTVDFRGKFVRYDPILHMEMEANSQMDTSSPPLDSPKDASLQGGESVTADRLQDQIPIGEAMTETDMVSPPDSLKQTSSPVLSAEDSTPSPSTFTWWLLLRMLLQLSSKAKGFFIEELFSRGKITEVLPIAACLLLKDTFYIPHFSWLCIALVLNTSLGSLLDRQGVSFVHSLSWIKRYQSSIHSVMEGLFLIQMLESAPFLGAFCSAARVLTFMIHSKMKFCANASWLKSENCTCRSHNKEHHHPLHVKLTCDGLKLGKKPKIAVGLQVLSGLGLITHCVNNVATLGIFSCAESVENYQLLLQPLIPTFLSILCVAGHNFYITYTICTDLLTWQHITYHDEELRGGIKCHFCPYCIVHFLERETKKSSRKSWKTFFFGEDVILDPCSSFVFCALHCDMRITAMVLLATYSLFQEIYSSKCYFPQSLIYLDATPDVLNDFFRKHDMKFFTIKEKDIKSPDSGRIDMTHSLSGKEAMYFTKKDNLI